MGVMIPRTALFLREDELRRGAALLQAASQNLTASEAALCRDHEIGPAQQRLLCYLSLCPNDSISDVTRNFQVSKQNLWRLLRPLIDRGFVATATDPQDRRRRALSLTPEGERVMREISAPALELMERAFRNQGAETVADFRNLLGDLAPEGWSARFYAEPNPQHEDTQSKDTRNKSKGASHTNLRDTNP